MANYYDLILGIIPVTLLGTSTGLHAAGVSITTAVAIGGFTAAILVGHALFINGPTDTTTAAHTTGTGTASNTDTTHTHTTTPGQTAD